MASTLASFVCSMSLAGAALAAFAAEPAVISAGFIYQTAPYPSCHASTIVETRSRQLVAAWFGGTHEKHPDVGIWLARWENGVWTRGVEVANGVQPDGTRHPTWNPVLFQPAAGPLLLFYKVGPSPQTWWGMVRTSADDGKTWSDARRLPHGILGPIKNKPVQLADGTILAPTSTESFVPPLPENATPAQKAARRPSEWRVHFERSTDVGRTWTATPPLNDGIQLAAIQPSILFHGPNRLQAVGRTRQGRVFEIWSNDAGRTWGPMRLMTLPNPNAGTDAVTLEDGRHLLVYNDTPKGRTPLTVAVSQDGQAWRNVVVLENQPGEYSYPAVIQASDGRIHVTYTWKRERIKHVVLDPARL